MSVRFTASVLAHREEDGAPARWLVLREYERPAVGSRFDRLLVFGRRDPAFAEDESWWRDLLGHLTPGAEIVSMTAAGDAWLDALEVLHRHLDDMFEDQPLHPC